MLCNGEKREGVKANLDLAYGLFCYVPLHKIRYGIRIEAKVKLGGHFILSLYSGQEAIKSIDCPNNGDTILIDKIIDQELGYRLIFKVQSQIEIKSSV